MQLLERAAERIRSGANAALGLVMAAAIAFDTQRASTVTSQWPYVLAFGAFVCAIALLRARDRAWAAVAGLAAFGLAAVVSALWVVTPSQVETAPLVALAVLAASQARWLAARQAVVISAVGVLVVAGAESSHAGGSFDPRALFALFGATIWGGAVAAGVWLRYLDHRRASTLEAVRRDERLELARELHDVVAHHVTGIVVQAQAARFAGQGHPGSVDAAFASIETAGIDTLAAIRRLVGLLRDPHDASGVAPGPEPIHRLVQRSGRHGPAVDLHLPADLTSAAWPPEVASTVYRIVQEALTNVARHAPDASAVTVTVAHDPRLVTVEVTDDASALPARPARDTGGYGLIGMRERVEALGGRLHAGPRAEAGWAVKASLPVPRPSRAVSITVLLADDQAMVRSGFRLILETQPGMTVVGEASDGAEAIALARELRPDISLIDIRMPELDGIEVTRALAGPDVADPLRVVIVTTYDTDEYVYGALQAGAAGFLLKDAGPALLIEAVRAAHAGDALISPSVTVRLLQQLAPAHRQKGPEPQSALSERELDIVASIAKGRTNQEIAADLFISLSTVKTHITRIQAKLDVRNRVEIAAWSWENRITDPT